MPLTPNSADSLAEPVAGVYRDAELRILQKIAASLALGLDTLEWQTTQLARLQVVRSQALAELSASNATAAQEIQDAISQAYELGGNAALADVGQALDATNTTTLQQQAAVKAIVSDAQSAITSAQPSILRGVEDVYRQVVAQATTASVSGAVTRREATQQALDEFAAQGITSIQLSRGRMGIADYSLMAVRTGASRSALQGHVDTMAANDLDLVVIHPGPRACDICDDWARKILSTTSGSPEGEVYLSSVLDGSPVRVHVDGSLDDARAGGWNHPNCRCALQAYLPGITKADDIERPTFNREQYEAQQRQRAIERQIRAWKNRQAVAITPEAASRAAAQVKSWQGAMRDHLEEHPYLKRQSAREQIMTPGAKITPPATLAKAQQHVPEPPKKPTATTPTLTPEPTKVDPHAGMKKIYVIPKGKTKPVAKWVPDPKAKAKAAAQAPAAPPPAKKPTAAQQAVKDTALAKAKAQAESPSAIPTRPKPSTVPTAPSDWKAASRNAVVAMPQEIGDSVRAYTGAAYRKINSSLWSSKGKTRNMPAAVRRDIQNIDAALEETPTPQQMRVFRDAGPAEFGVKSVEDVLKLAGKTGRQDGFLSTTAESGYKFSKGRIRVEVVVPEGSPAAYVNSKKLTDFSEEREVIVGRGAVYTLSNPYYDARTGAYRVTMTILDFKKGD